MSLLQCLRVFFVCESCSLVYDAVCLSLAAPGRPEAPALVGRRVDLTITEPDMLPLVALNLAESGVGGRAFILDATDVVVCCGLCLFG